VKKKYHSLTKTGLPRLKADDLSFAAGKPASFAEVFDPERFDREAANMLSRKEEPGTAPKKSQKDQRKKAPQSFLDLHGCTGREAEIRVADFIRIARQQSLLCVRIVTGRGLHSQGPAVLPDVVEQKIRELKEQKIIHGYQWDKGDKGASGAMLVWL